MAVLTWRNVDAPDFSVASEAMARAGEGFSRAAGTFKGSMDSLHEQQVTAHSNAAAARLASFTDRGSLEAALQDGTALGAGVIPGLINQETTQAMLGRRSELLANDDTLNTMTNRDAQTDINRGHLGVAQGTLGLAERRQSRTEAQETAGAQITALQGQAAELYEADKRDEAAAILRQASGLAVQHGLPEYGQAIGNSLGEYAKEAFGEDIWDLAVRAANSGDLAAAQRYANTLPPQHQARFLEAFETAEAQRGVLSTLPTQEFSVGGSAPVAGQWNPGNVNTGSIIGTESGGNFQIGINSAGIAAGRAQMTNDRLQDAADAGIIPQGTTIEEYKNFSAEDQLAVEEWHWADHTRNIQNMGLDKYLGSTINGVVIDENAMLAMAHLGGLGGLQNYLESGGASDTSDVYGTALSEYAATHSGAGQRVGPTQAAAASGQMAQSPVADIEAPTNINPTTIGPMADSYQRTLDGFRDTGQSSALDATIERLESVLGDNFDYAAMRDETLNLMPEGTTREDLETRVREIREQTNASDAVIMAAIVEDARNGNTGQHDIEWDSPNLVGEAVEWAEGDGALALAQQYATGGGVEQQGQRGARLDQMEADLAGRRTTLEAAILDYADKKRDENNLEPGVLDAAEDKVIAAQRAFDDFAKDIEAFQSSEPPPPGEEPTNADTVMQGLQTVGLANADSTRMEQIEDKVETRAGGWVGSLFRDENGDDAFARLDAANAARADYLSKNTPAPNVSLADMAETSREAGGEGWLLPPSVRKQLDDPEDTIEPGTPAPARETPAETAIAQAARPAGSNAQQPIVSQVADILASDRPLRTKITAVRRAMEVISRMPPGPEKEFAMASLQTMAEDLAPS